MFHKTGIVCLVFLVLSVNLSSQSSSFFIEPHLKELKESAAIIEIERDVSNNHTEIRAKLQSFQENEDAASLENKKALEIYKVIMIFTCCVLAIVLVLFLICILKNTDSLAVPTTSSSVNLNEAYLSCEDGSIGAQNGNGLLINLPFEKPPSYLEVLQEIGSPPPIYSDDQHTNANSDVQNQIASSAIRLQSELVLDCNQWLEQANSERSCLETRLAIELRRSELRRLSRNLERFNFPNILSRCHSSPIIRNSLLLKNQHLIDILSSSQDTSPANRTSQSTPTQVSGVNLVVNRTNLPDDQSSASTSQT